MLHFDLFVCCLLQLRAENERLEAEREAERQKATELDLAEIKAEDLGLDGGDSGGSGGKAATGGGEKSGAASAQTTASDDATKDLKGELKLVDSEHVACVIEFVSFSVI